VGGKKGSTITIHRESENWPRTSAGESPGDPKEKKISTTRSGGALLKGWWKDIRFFYLKKRGQSLEPCKDLKWD